MTAQRVIVDVFREMMEDRLPENGDDRRVQIAHRLVIPLVVEL